MVILPISPTNTKKIDRYFSIAEINYYRQLTGAKQSQWLAGQIASKQAIKKYLSKRQPNLDYKNIIIKKRKTGQPYYQNLFLSISHSQTMAAAAVNNNGQIGIDIETIREFPLSVYKKFLTPDEKTWIQTLPKKQQKIYTTLFWSIKEAYLKARGVGLRQHPASINLIKTKNSFRLQHKNKVIKCDLWYNINTKVNYVLVRLILKKPHNDR